ncbi:receptor-type adenylate cyclase, partial [Trypanosoma conorhini]
RVRVGVHTGLCDIRRDEVTKGYDYYGDTANVAARTEAVGNGGQVLLTRAAYMALGTTEREQLEVTALGAVALRGVPRPVEMYQLDAVPGRTFAALRLDREVADLEVDGEDTPSSGEETSASTAQNGPAQAILSVMDVMFGIFATPRRLKVLRPICERWRVDAPRGAEAAREEEACRVAMERLAEKMGRVMQKRASKTSVEGESRKTTVPLLSFSHSLHGLQLLNSAFEGSGRHGRRHSRVTLSRASSAAAQTVSWEREEPDNTIHAPRPA